jgi:hypothetical protein
MKISRKHGFFSAFEAKLRNPRPQREEANLLSKPPFAKIPLGFFGLFSCFLLNVDSVNIERYNQRRKS